MAIYIFRLFAVMLSKQLNNKNGNLFIKKISFFMLTLFTIASAQNTAMFSGRAHPELNWKTISTENFNVHYHQGIEELSLIHI